MSRIKDEETFIFSLRIFAEIYRLTWSIRKRGENKQFDKCHNKLSEIIRFFGDNLSCNREIAAEFNLRKAAALNAVFNNKIFVHQPRSTEYNQE